MAKHKKSKSDLSVSSITELLAKKENTYGKIIEHVAVNQLAVGQFAGLLLIATLCADVPVAIGRAPISLFAIMNAPAFVLVLAAIFKGQNNGSHFRKNQAESGDSEEA